MKLQYTYYRRFWKKVDKPDSHVECWNWTGSKNLKGYGQFQFNKERWLAHRLSYAIHKTDIPDGYMVTHTCDNPSCVNPNHLVAGTAKYNSRDMVNKGRHPEHTVTHCPQGHEYTPENTYRQPTRPNQRLCRECRRIKERLRPPRTKKVTNG